MLYKKEIREKKERHRCEKKGKENRKKFRGKYSIVTIINRELLCFNLFILSNSCEFRI